MIDYLKITLLTLLLGGLGGGVVLLLPVDRAVVVYPVVLEGGQRDLLVLVLNLLGSGVVLLVLVLNLPGSGVVLLLPLLGGHVARDAETL